MAALSIPRGNGKSTLAGRILERCMTPGGPFSHQERELCPAGGLARAGAVCFQSNAGMAGTRPIGRV